MSKPDEHDERAARILPCKCSHILGSAYNEMSITALLRALLRGHIERCPAYYRPALAAEFRADAEKQSGEKAVWLRDYNARLAEGNELRREANELRFQAEKHTAEVEQINKDRDRLIEANKYYLTKMDQLQAELASLRAAATAKDQEMAAARVQLRAADALAKVIDEWVVKKFIDARSAIADARLDYGDPFKYQAKQDAELERVKAEVTEAWKVGAEAENERNDLRARLEQAEKERDEMRASLQRASYSGLRGNVANLRIELHDIKVKHQHELDAVRLNALRDALDALDGLPDGIDCSNAIAALIDAGKPKP